VAHFRAAFRSTPSGHVCLPQPPCPKHHRALLLAPGGGGLPDPPRRPRATRNRPPASRQNTRDRHCKLGSPNQPLQHLNLPPIGACCRFTGGTGGGGSCTDHTRANCLTTEQRASYNLGPVGQQNPQPETILLCGPTPRAAGVGECCRLPPSGRGVLPHQRQRGAVHRRAVLATANYPAQAESLPAGAGCLQPVRTLRPYQHSAPIRLRRGATGLICSARSVFFFFLFRVGRRPAVCVIRDGGGGACCKPGFRDPLFWHEPTSQSTPRGGENARPTLHDPRPIPAAPPTFDWHNNPTLDPVARTIFSFPEQWFCARTGKLRREGGS